MSRLLTRSQLGRVTHWFPTHHHHPYPSSSSSSSSSSSNITITSFIKQCSTTATNVASSENGKKRLPENIVQLICRSSAEGGFCEVYLVGTDHISKRSCLEVQTVINFLKPEVVFLEMCRKRQSMLTAKHLKEPTVKEMIAMIRKNNTNILGLLIRSFYALRLLKNLRSSLVLNFAVAYEEAMKYGGKVFLGDRPVEITLTRAWRMMPLSEKIRLFSLACSEDGSSSTEDRLSSIKDCSSLTELLTKLCARSDEIGMDEVALRIQEMSKISPTLVETIIHERDLCMSSTLLQVAQKSRCVVAVVGKGHLEGIKKHWGQPISVADLLTVPPPKHTAKFLTSVGVVMVGVAMIWRCL